MKERRKKIAIFYDFVNDKIMAEFFLMRWRCGKMLVVSMASVAFNIISFLHSVYWYMIIRK